MYTEKQQDEIKRLRTENKDLIAKVVAMEAQLYPTGSQPSAPPLEHLVRTNLDGAVLSSVRGDGWRTEMLQFVHTGDGVVQLCGVFVREKRVQPGPVVAPRASSIVVSTTAILTADEVARSVRGPETVEAAPAPLPESEPEPVIDEDEAKAQEAASMAAKAEDAIRGLSTWALGRLAEVVGQQTMSTGRRISKEDEFPLHKLLTEHGLIDRDGVPTALAWIVCRRYARMQEEAQRVADEMEPTIQLLVLGIRDRRIDLTPEQFELALLVKLGVTDTTRGGIHLSPFGNLVGDILDARRKAAAAPLAEPSPESAPADEAKTPDVRQLSNIPPAAVPATSEGWMVGQPVVTRRGRAGKVVKASGDRLVLIESARERRGGKAVCRWHYAGDLMQA